ncbi:MAG: hypothetical protein ACI9G1_002932 [Pirellulaceae bacterium]|jgi:hypothetical protein
MTKVPHFDSDILTSTTLFHKGLLICTSGLCIWFVYR